MQILEIILYGKNGKRRRLKLKPGKVNIITGDSATGKSALIEITDYCLGKSTCSVPSGVIRDTVEWFAIKIQTKNRQMFIARTNPIVGKTSSSVYFEEANTVVTPKDAPTKPNSTVDALIEQLSNKIGISPNLYVPPRGQTRTKLSATIRHALFYCFQKQDEIANSKLLFHRQADGFISQSIKDSLNYFLGAIREDDLALYQKLYSEKRRLKLLEREYQEEESIQGESLTRAIQLFTESRQVGILSSDFSPSAKEDFVTILKKAVTWEPKEIKVSNQNLLSELQNQLFDLKEQLRDKNSEIDSASLFAKEAEGFTDEVVHQEKRLESIHLFSDNGHNSSCPLCSQSVNQPSKQIDDINSTLLDIKNSLQDTIQINSNLREYLNKLELERSELRNQINEKKIQVSSLLEQNKNYTRFQENIILQSEVIGKIKLWLDSVATISENSILENKIKVSQKKIDELGELLSDDEKTSRLNGIVHSMGTTMTEWAKELNLEHSEYPVIFDISKLTVKVSRGDEIIQLSDMGSGENWLGYHLIVNFALHSHFRNHNRPVPRFLFLDQPSQVYYPPELAKESDGALDVLPDSDKLAVQRLFKFIFSKTNEMQGDFQVIITDHAKLSDSYFTKSILEEWRNGAKLIPTIWYE